MKMKTNSTKLFSVTVLLLLMLSLISGCATSGNHDAPASDETSAVTGEIPAIADDIVILCTTDVHCAVDADIGYAGVAAYKKAIQAKTPYVTLVDCGDAVQGDTIGTVSRGEYIINIMNKVGYDLAVIGNHEFDYGMDRLGELIDKADAKYISANITYSGEEENALAAVKPYEIINYGDTSVAFIGVTTPHSITSSTPAYFMDGAGNFVYGLCNSDDGSVLYDRVQSCVDECRAAGADYVVVCGHLGEDESFTPYSSTELIANTEGIDALLDGHAHVRVPCHIVKNKNGSDVVITSAGVGLESMAQIVITPDGGVFSGIVTGYADKDATVSEYIEGIKSSYEADMKKVVAASETALSCADENGIRLVRCRETSIGDFCADAYRAIAQADIALVNGGGIRADIPQGDVTYADIISVHPYGNSLCMVRATGQEIIDALEIGCRATESVFTDGENAVGESGAFLNVSGLKYTIDTSVTSTVVLDENGMFSSVSGARRVRDVTVFGADGAYTPIDPAATYTVAGHNYMMKNSGDGINVFADNELLINEGMLDYEVLITYISEKLSGSIPSSYSVPDGRITVIG